jgi:hypothetical protein
MLRAIVLAREISRCCIFYEKEETQNRQLIELRARIAHGASMGRG